MYCLLHQLHQVAEECDCQREQHQRGQYVKRVVPVPMGDGFERHTRTSFRLADQFAAFVEYDHGFLPFDSMFWVLALSPWFWVLGSRFSNPSHTKSIAGTAGKELPFVAKFVAKFVVGEQGLIEEAMEHALAAGEPEKAAHMIEQRAEAMIINSEVATIQRWIDRLPPDMVHKRHRLALASAGALASVGAVAKIEPLLQAAEHTQLPEARGVSGYVSGTLSDTADRGWLDDIISYCETMRSIVARAEGDLPRAIALGQAALEHLPNRFVFMRAVAAWNLGMAYWFSGELSAAAAALHAVWTDHQSAYMYVLAVIAASLGQIRVIQGQLHEAAQLCRQAIRHVATARASIPSVGLIHIGLADVLREWNDLEGAVHHLTDGLSLGKAFGSADVLIAGYTTLARVKHAQGDHSAAAEALAQAQELTPNSVFSPGSSQPARLWLAQGNIAAAEVWATSNGIGVDTPVHYGYEIQQVILARVLLARKALARQWQTS